jgi:hypothetical protein
MRSILSYPILSYPVLFLGTSLSVILGLDPRTHTKGWKLCDHVVQAITLQENASDEGSLQFSSFVGPRVKPEDDGERYKEIKSEDDGERNAKGQNRTEQNRTERDRTHPAPRSLMVSLSNHASW